MEIKIVRKCIKPVLKCDFEAAQISHLTRHVKPVHVEIKYQCGKCEYKALWKESLPAHSKSVHVGTVSTCQKSVIIKQ